MDYTNATFVGTLDYTYTFRLKATDNVSNTTENWQVSQPTTVHGVTKYYTHGSNRVAMRRGDALYYLSGDHLGSTSLTTDENGDIVSEVRYLPYGEERWTNGATPTDFTFTGQRNEAGFGLMDYNARYYSARLGRFVSPDTIIPEPINSQGFNRYSYANNNPLKYTDPSGHQGCDEQVEDCDDSDQDKELLDQKDEKIEDNLDASSPPISDEDLAKFLSAVGFGLDVTGLGINFLGAAVTDIAFGGLGPVGYAAGVSAHNAVLTGPTLVVDGIGVGFVAAAGFVTGENQIGFDNGTLTLTLNQDTIVAAGGFVAGGINPEPNVDVLISGGAVAYDYGRFPFEQHEPFYTYPTHFDSVTIQAGMRNSFSVQYLNCAPETGH